MNKSCMRVLHDITSLPTFNKAVITIGSFDGVHSAHQNILKKLNQIANEIGGESVVITFHPHPRSIIYPRDQDLQLLTDLSERLTLLEKNGIQNVVVVPFSVEFSQQSPYEYVEKFLIGKFNPAYIVIGYDHRFGLNRSGNFDLLEQYATKGKFKLVEIVKQELEHMTISSTQIRNALKEGDILLANSLLNHQYPLTGKVVHGKEIGKTLGYPTANIQLSEPKKLIPKEGVYAVVVEFENSEFGGMMHIGNRPSIKDDGNLSIEVNIFDFNQIIYNKEIKVRVVNQIRENERFDNLVLLQKQLQRDEKDALAILEKFNIRSVECQLAVAILNYNGQELLESYLPSVLYSHSNDFQVYVIDNGSTDDSIEYLEEWHPEVKVIQLSTNYGFAQGYNKGIASITEPYIAILNSDVRVEENWLDPIMNAFKKDRHLVACQAKIKSDEHDTDFEYAGAAGGMMDYLGYPFCRGRIFDTVEEDTKQYDQEDPNIFWASGAAMVVRRDAFIEVGGFDVDYFAHQEEIDLCWRFQLLGYAVQYIPESVVYHLGGATLSYESPRKTRLNFRNNLITILKNDYSSWVWLKLFARLILDGVAGVKYLIEAKPLSTVAIFKAHLGFYKRFFSTIEKRKTQKRVVILKRRRLPKTKFYSRSILWQYFVKGNKTYSQLSK